MSPIAPDLDPADAVHRVALRDQLRAIRVKAGYTVTAVAVALDHRRASVSYAECNPRPNQLLATVQRHARALGYVAVPVLHGLTVPADPYLSMLDDLTYGPDPDRADEAARVLLFAQLGAARRALGRKVEDVAPGLGIEWRTLYQIEAARYSSMIGTGQRYARVLGGWLTIDLQSADAPLEAAA